MKKVAIALSGGVDSAGAALLLKREGYAVSGVTLQLHHGNDLPDGSGLSEEAAAARKTAEAIGIGHTVLVMGSIYLLMAQQYAEAKNVALSAVFGLVLGTVTASGIPEALAAAILVSLIGRAVLPILRKKNLS